MNFEEVEERIKSIIKSYPREQYDTVISRESWLVFRELTSLRECLLNWYPFRGEAKVLEISEGFGALTGLLGRNCKEVTVISEMAAEAEAIRLRYADCPNIKVNEGTPREQKEKYDYVIIDKAVSNINSLREVLSEVDSFLNENGVVILVCLNRFSVREFCGAPNNLKKPFENIRNNMGVTYQGLLNCVNDISWCNDWKIYYPFPDHELPQAIYTNEYIPSKSIRDRVIPYYTDEQKKSILMLEDELYDGLIENGIFHILANSFLVECRRKAVDDYVIYAALSKDRGERYGFATTIWHQGRVRKMVLDPAGRESLSKIYTNNQELAKRQIDCVPMILKEDYIDMPYIKEKVLIDYLQDCFFNDKDQVLTVFDLLYQNILNSSEHVEDVLDATRGTDVEKYNPGIILRKAYIDMIPYNAFYIGGKLVFYDQEFVFQNCPAKFVLFRAIRYTYVYIKGAEQIISIQFFKDKYALNELWPIFEQEEARFIEKNRNYNSLNCFYQWASTDQKILEKNLLKLVTEAEEKKEQPNYRLNRGLDKYYKDIALSKVKRVQLDILKEFQKVCQENNLSYCAFYGTLLGAIRHGGVVPWDDDIDVLMPRYDYDKLTKISKVVFDMPLFLQTPENDRQCFYGGYSKLRNSATTGLESKNMGHICNQGIWIDIFPLDYVPDGEEEKREQLEKIRRYQRCILAKVYPENAMWEEYRDDGYTLEELYQCLRDSMTNSNGTATSKVAVLSRYYREQDCPVYDAKDFEYLIKYPFEGSDIYVPVGYEHCLKIDYGEDYMIYPEEKERHRHHDAVYVVDKPYYEFLS